MTPGARIAAAITVLDQVLGGIPAERALTGWARGSRFAGSKDRAAVRDQVFDALRAKRSLAACGGAMTGRGLMIGLVARENLGFDRLFNGEGYAPEPLTASEQEFLGAQSEVTAPEAHDIPDWLWPQWCESLGEQAETAATAQQVRADVYLRINQRRCSPETAIATLAADDVTAELHPKVASCLRVTGNARRVKQARAYLDGLVELQDAASQFALSAVPVPAGGRILDYCAGGGGKALGFADQRDASVFAHDIAPARMIDLPQRAARAGVKISVLQTNALKKQSPFDVVVCDAPCSGSGTWRRAPDAKWRLTQADLEALNRTQYEVICSAAPLTAQDGLLVYATCSVLDAENGAVVARFLENNPAWKTVFAHRLAPGPDWDGFFVCGLQRT